MPRDPDATPICSPEKAACVREAVVVVEKTAFESGSDSGCQCLPSCTDIEYPHKYSSVQLGRRDLLHFPDTIKGQPSVSK